MDKLNFQENIMTEESNYTVKVGELVERLGLSGIDLVRLCLISPGTAYTACKNGNISLKTCNKIYTGLKKAGYDIRFEDVVQID